MPLFFNVCITIIVLGFTAFTNATPIERHVFAVSANNGGNDRPILRYAQTDAKSFVGVLSEMGGVNKGNAVLLHEPSVSTLKQEFDKLDRRIIQSKKNGARQELLVYYSGHADDKGLHLGHEIYTWSDLRKKIDSMSASVKIAVIDACGSGAITRMKGGVAVPAFMVDASSDMNGYAFITSSTQNEASQESDRLQGSFFTHSLVSGLRGAGDASGDGKVTLSEAYQFAFNETLQKTQTTMGGAQHPSRDMNLTGTGDVVITDIRNTSAGLILDEKMEGRIFIRDDQNRLVAELQKLSGRSLELGLPSGKYKVQMILSEQNLACDVSLKEGRKEKLSNQKFTRVELSKTVSRGGEGSSDSLPMSSKRVSFNLIDNEKLPRKGTQFGFFVANAEEDMVGSQFSLILNNARKSFLGLQLSAVGNIAKNIDGTQISSVFNIAKEEMDGVQITSGVNIAQEMDGIQLSAALNLLTKKSKGLQIGSLNIATDSLKGAQIGAINVAKSVNFQLSSINWADNVNTQISTLNWADSVKFQLSSFNMAKSVNTQISALNWAQSITGLQLGVINMASQNKGRAIGVVNICPYCEKTPIGLINIVGNGVWTFSSSIDETGSFLGNVRLGTANFFTIFEASRPFSFSDKEFKKGMRSGFGFGTQFGSYGTHFDLDFVTLLDYNRWTPAKICNFDFSSDDDYNFVHRIRIGATYQVIKGIGLVGGISGNVVSEGSESSVHVKPKGEYHAEWYIAGRYVRVWPGLYAGFVFGRF